MTRKALEYLLFLVLVVVLATVIPVVVRRAVKPREYTHQRAAKQCLSRYERFATLVDPAALAGQSMIELQVPDDLRAVGVMGIVAGRQTLVFYLPTNSLDSDEAVLYLPTDSGVMQATADALEREKLASRWYFVVYD